jgi:enamine deaminase RidA (YjgF/YER057c/UK114 family)
MEVPAGWRVLCISGQIAAGEGTPAPDDFEAQAHAVWHNLGAILTSAGMDYAHLVHVRTYLARREDAAVNGAIRRHYLGAHTPALTVVVAGLLDPAWLLEIEAMAAAPPISLPTA